jgi:hypothetical protein
MLVPRDYAVPQLVDGSLRKREKEREFQVYCLTSLPILIADSSARCLLRW